jgi:hypothetical protein
VQPLSPNTITRHAVLARLAGEMACLHRIIASSGECRVRTVRSVAD